MQFYYNPKSFWLTKSTFSKLIFYFSISIISLAFFSGGITTVMKTMNWFKDFCSWRVPLSLEIPVGIVEMSISIGILFGRTRLLTVYGVFIWAVVAIILPAISNLWPQSLIPALLVLFNFFIFQYIRYDRV